MGTTNPLSNLFGKSPFKLLRQHIHVAVECANQVPELFRALTASDMNGLNACKDRIFQMERQADQVKNTLRHHLPKSLFLPVDRRDLLEILDFQDNIADTAQDIAEFLVLRPMPIPEALADPLQALLTQSLATCHKAAASIDSLAELIETGFGGKEITRTMDMVDQLELMEHDADELERTAILQLFAMEDHLPPVSVIFWYRIIQWLGQLADHGDKVGDRLRLVTASAR